MKLRILALAFAATLPLATYADSHAPASKAASASATGHAPHWSYEGKEGPDKWGQLDKEFSTCAIGKLQTPIDIPAGKAGKSNLGPIAFSYKPSPLKILDNGHTIQVNVEPGSSIKVGGNTYELKQFHFHRPSEEKVDGKSYELVAHLVHKSAEGNLAVVGVLFEQGAEDPLLKTLWANLPRDKGREIPVPGVTINPNDLLPAKRSYYNFQGSLTTPPCSEGVNWFVLTTPEKASKVQIERFAAIYPMNARPTQALNGRAVEVGGR